jgi:hypothetical protein
MDFVLTSDLDWASEHCIEHFLEVAARFSIKPALFVTHESAAVRRASAEGRVELGVHPNFLPGSTQGNNVDEVMDHVLHLVPKPIAVRCHRYFWNEQIAATFAARGLQLDSNDCAHLKRDLKPIALLNNSLRLPVFFEDDVHWTRGHSWRFEEFAADFFSAGLKVLNFHPFFVTLNVPDAAFYAQHKSQIQGLTSGKAARMRHCGAGAGTFLTDAATAILDRGHRFVALSELARRVVDDSKIADRRRL